MFSMPYRSKEKKQMKQEAETGEQFYKDQSFSIEIEAEREYVHRLKMQRQKIQALYLKYDSLLNQMKKKDDRIKELEKNLSGINYKYKQLELMIPEIERSKHENYRLYNENEVLKANIERIEESYNEIIRELSSKSNLSQLQYEKLGELNSQLATKIRIWQQKLQDKTILFEKQKKSLTEKIQQIQKQLDSQKSKHLAQISLMNTELLKKDEEIDILHNQLQKYQENLIYLEQSSIDLGKEHEVRLTRVQNQYKNKIKVIKQEVQELNYNNQMLSSKIVMLNSDIQKLNSENSCLRDSICDEKKISDEALYHLKLQFSQQKSIMREHTMQLENRLNKVEKQLGDSLRKQKALLQEIHRLQEGESVKKSIREIEKRELQKINRLLLLEK